MSGLIDKRKRSREDDFICENETPLSKRINALHLTNHEQQPTTSQQQQQRHHNSHNNYLMPKDMMLYPQQQQQHNSSALITNHNNNVVANLKPMLENNSVMENLYNPDMNELENPFYYMKNKLLHELHLERLKRCSI